MGTGQFTPALRMEQHTANGSWLEFMVSWRMAAGSLLAVVGSTLANTAGVGGGGLFVPMFRLFFGFDVKTSAALSKAMIMGGAVASALYNLPLKHPEGISLGVLCSVVFPDWILTLLFMLVLLGIAWRTFRMGLSTWREEQREPPDFLKASPEQRLLSPDVPTSSRQRVDWSNILILCSVWTFYFVLQILKDKTETCGKLYWLLNACQIPVSLVPTTVGIWRLQRRKVYARQRCEEGPSFEQMLLYPVYGVLAGIVGGLLGIGGGMILAPLFLELGISPQVTAATTTFIVVFSSSMSVVEFYLLGRVPLKFASYYTLLSGLSALLGLHVTKLLIARYRRTSFIIFLLAFIIGTSAIVLGVMGTFLDVHKLMAGESMGFHRLC